MGEQRHAEWRNTAEDLRRGERVLWESGVQRFGLLDGTQGRQVLRHWLATASALLVGLIAYHTLAQHFQQSVIVVLLVIAGVLLVSPVLEWYYIQGQQYILTNQRAILVRGDKTVFAMEIRDIDDAQIVRLSARETCLLLGSQAVAEPLRQLRWRAAHPMEDLEDGQNVHGLVFYGVRDAERALSLVSQGAAG